MSMGYFFKAFTEADMAAMENDHDLIDQKVFDEPTYLHSTDVENAWDVLMNVLDGAGFQTGDFLDDVLMNGGTFVSAADVKDEAAQLARWSREDVADAVSKLDPHAGLYRQEIYQGDVEALLEEFDYLVEFYTKAAADGLGVIHYAA